MDESREFYQKVIALTKESKKRLDEVSLIARDIEIVVNLITRKFQQRVLKAASLGKNAAYLCIYSQDSRYREIPIHDFLLGTYGPVMDRLRAALHPFPLEHGKFSDETLFPPKYKVYYLRIGWNE